MGPGGCWSAAGFANIRLQHGGGAGELKCARPGVGLAGGPPGNQGGVACGVGLSVGCMVSKLYEYVFTGAAVGTADGVHSLEALNPLNAMKGFGEL